MLSTFAAFKNLVTFVITQYKPTKCKFSKLIFQCLILMSSTCFKPEGSSLGRRLYIQLWYGTVRYGTVMVRCTCIGIISLVGSIVSSIILLLVNFFCLTLILLTWRIWWDPNNASKWQMGFNSAFKRLINKFKSP
jgi:hypothetical protein